uniref:Putative secreted protein n=1 Tax=Anopheles darlingi TaxID=43151 RepID=A0A2M4DKW1_ANODA
MLFAMMFAFGDQWLLPVMSKDETQARIQTTGYLQAHKEWLISICSQIMQMRNGKEATEEGTETHKKNTNTGTQEC